MIGLETEYGFRRSTGTAPPRGIGELYEQVRQWYSERGPTVASLSHDRRFFLANGGCIGIEPALVDDQHAGLLEGATPECRSPSDLIRFQVAQDQSLMQCLVDLQYARAAAWIKCSSDAYGAVYGQHENYEVEIAHGWRLVAWRIGLFGLLPLLLVYHLLAWGWLRFLHGCDSLSRWFRQRLERRRHPKRTTEDRRQGRQPATEAEWSAGWTRLGANGLRWIHFPIACYLHLLIWLFALIPHRRMLTGFLISRMVIDGSGHLDRAGKYWLSSRAATINGLIGFGQYWGERPIFQTGHWLRSLLTDPRQSMTAWRRLFQVRQRIQIPIGDSTPNPQSQYLRVGMTCLVLDMIESHANHDFPRFKKDVQALKAFASDPSLLRALRDRSGRYWSAMAIQHHYASMVRKFIADKAEAGTEAMDIVEQWHRVLDQLNEHDHDSESRRWLLGRVDWMSKRWLIENAADKNCWSSQKKIDIKYHELSEQGYFFQMANSLSVESMVSQDEVRRASLLPPSGTPATRRGYCIREFSCDRDRLRVDWQVAEWMDDRGYRRRFSFDA